MSVTLLEHHPNAAIEPRRRFAVYRYASLGPFRDIQRRNLDLYAHVRVRLRFHYGKIEPVGRPRLGLVLARQFVPYRLRAFRT